MEKHTDNLGKFLLDQLSVWPEAAAAYRALKEVRTRKVHIRGLDVVLQHNPARKASAVADVRDGKVGPRKCFLCGENRPQVQAGIPFDGRKGRKYTILVNPFPIFSRHFTVASDSHEPQTILNRLVDMADMAHHFPDYTVFYNGPRCGASAPDHLHFQMCPRGVLPLEVYADKVLDEGRLQPIASVKEAKLYQCQVFADGVFFLSARTSKSLARLFYRLMDCVSPGEPMMNVIAWYKPYADGDVRPPGNTHGLAGFEYRLIVALRGAHRPHHFFSEGDDRLEVSPGAVDMAGLIILHRAEDFDKMTPELLGGVLREVSISDDGQDRVIERLSRRQPVLHVGIMSAGAIDFEVLSDRAGVQRVEASGGRLLYCGSLYDELVFDAPTPSGMFAGASFVLYGVTIGVDFHWQRSVTGRYAGALRFVADGDKVVAINEIGVEDYLLSVICSEMKATAPPEFLKAHAVISRSWVYSQLARRESADCSPDSPSATETASDVAMCPGAGEGAPKQLPEVCRWYDSSDHALFDVCADDHCQRYQGVPQVAKENVRTAIDATWGQVLTYGGEICDARFSKCCGGVSELYKTCWEDIEVPYLQALADTPGHDPQGECFCAKAAPEILRSVLNGYDLETPDFFEWEERYTVDELSDIFLRRSGMDLGRITALVPLATGPSGRIYRLRVDGEKGSVIIGKELTIRRFLSESHLKSSAFTASFHGDEAVLKGRGWGHGAGLCQIGAAQMASEGYSYNDILDHYYPGAVLSCRVCGGKEDVR